MLISKCGYDPWASMPNAPTSGDHRASTCCFIVANEMLGVPWQSF